MKIQFKPERNVRGKTSTRIVPVMAVTALLLSIMEFPDCCTVFTASIGNAVLFGNNEDVGDRNSTVWFVPATESAHGWVYFGFLDYPSEDSDFPMGGMNDHGLCFDITSVPESKMRPHPEKLRARNAGILGQRVLENCATIGEAINFIERYDFSSFGEFQFLFADRTGDSIVLCPGTDGEMKAIRKEGAYEIITNFNVLNPGLGEYPCWRYSAALTMLNKIESEDDLTVEYFTSILKAVYTRHTTYSTIYDPVNGIIHLYNKHTFDEVVVFNLEDELKKGYHSYYVPSLFTEKGRERPEHSEEPEESKKPVEAQGSEISLSRDQKSEEPEVSPTPVPEPEISLPPFSIIPVVLMIGIIVVAMIVIRLQKQRE